MCKEIYLTVNKLEDLDRDIMKFIIDRANHGLNGAFDGLNTGLQGTRILFGVTIHLRYIERRMNHRHLQKFQILQFLFLSLSLQSQNQTKNKKKNKLDQKSKISSNIDINKETNELKNQYGGMKLKLPSRVVEA